MLTIKQHYFVSLIFLSFFSSSCFAQESSSPSNPEDLYHVLVAEFAIERGQYNAGLNHYLKTLDADPSSYISERATRLSLYKKRYQDMQKSAQTWKKNSPESPMALFFLSLAYAHQDEPKAAFQSMHKVLQYQQNTDFTRLSHLLDSKETRQWYLSQLLPLSQKHPQNYDINLAAAMLFQHQQDDMQSLKHLALATQYPSNNIALYRYAAKLYANLERPNLALSMYQSATETNPSNHDLRLQYAQFASQHAPGIARQQFEILRLQMPNNELILLNLGLIYLETEQFSQAQKMFSALLEKQQQTALAHYYLGQIAKHEQQWNSALHHFEQITDNNTRSRANEQIANIYIQQQRYDDAHIIIDQELTITDDRERMERFNLLKALLLQQEGHIQKAYHYLSEQLNQSPNSVDIRYNRAMLAELQDDLLLMEEDLRHIIALHPNSTLALNALGYTLAKKTDRLDEAYMLIQQALSISPQDPAVLDSMGWVLYRMGHWQEALTYLQQAMVKLPDAEVAAHLAEVLWMLGQKDDAKVLLLEALNQTPDHNELNEIIKRLNIPL